MKSTKEQNFHVDQIEKEDFEVGKKSLSTEMKKTPEDSQNFGRKQLTFFSGLFFALHELKKKCLRFAPWKIKKATFFPHSYFSFVMIYERKSEF